MEPTWETVAGEVRARFGRGQRTAAWRLLEPHWRQGVHRADPDFLQLAHDVAWWLGFETRRFWLGRRIWRTHPDRLWAWARTAFDLVRRGRLLAAWELQRRADRPDAASAEEEAYFALATARTLTHLRDFGGAATALQRAEAAVGPTPSLLRERCWTAWEQDDLDGAFAAMREARATWPEDPFLREQECWFLLQRGDRDEALAAVAGAAAAIECPSLDLMHADALFDAGRAAAARDVLARTAEVQPMERRQRDACHMLLARALRALGDDAAALAALQRAGRGLRKWADRLAAFVAGGEPPGSGRVALAVPYVRQDHVTCSPATMASLLGHAGIAVDQREIAAQITYDGTPSHAELAWARGRGLEMWFFQFDPAVARRLIDLGLPFAVSTRFEQSGHRQALVGYDRALGTFLLRDPGVPILQEVDAEWLDANLRSRGGDCALLLPEDRRHLVPVAELPAGEATMLLQELRQAYERRDLGAAERIGERLLAGDESHVRWEAAVRIANERGDRRWRLELWQQGYERHRDDAYWQYNFARELRSQDRWSAFVELLLRHVGGRSPYLSMLLADHLRHAASTRAEAERLARRAVRLLPRRSGPVKLLADVLWDDVGRRDVATEFYRLASCLEPFDEDLADSYFVACRHLGRTEDGLAHLRERVATLGRRRSGPGATLARALDTLHRRGDAIATLRQALAVHESHEAREQLFGLLLADGQRGEAAALLQEGDHRWRPLALQQARLRLARAAGDHAAAAAALAQAVAIDPANGELRQQLLREVLATEGRAAAIAAAERCVAEHGDDPLLLVRVQEFFDEIEERAAAERLLRRLVAEHPREWWLLGRLQRFLLRNGRAAEAAPMVATMLEHVPDSLAAWLDAIDVADLLGDRDLAVQRADRAAERWAAEPSVLQRRRTLATSAAASRAAVEQAMAAVLASHLPPTGGDLDALVAAANRDLDGEAVQRFLEQVQARFPGQPEIAAARCRWLVHEDPAAAVPIAEQLAADFPWLLDHWLLQARCLRAAGRRTEERALLERLLEREPTLGQAWVELGESLEEEGRTEEALAIYERGIAQAPRHAVLHGMRANLLWTLGDRDAALAAADRAATLDSDYGWARRVQVLWRAECGQADAALRAAEACVRDNPSWSHAHELLAVAHAALGNHDRRVAALQQALRCDPRLGSARSRLLEALLELRRFDEAETVVAEGLQLLGDVPSLLLVRIRIQRFSGELVPARARLRELLVQHPDFEAGWLELLAWLDEERIDDELLALAKDPPAALAERAALHGYAADVHQRRGDLPAAVRSLRRALEMAPGYEWARDSLADVLLRQGEHRGMLELYPGATDPTKVPFRRAAMIADAAAATGHRGRAEQFFERLLREPEADAETLATVDAELRRRHGRRQLALVRAALDASATQRDALRHENCLAVLAGRKDRSFWPRLTRFLGWLPAAEHEIRAARLVYFAERHFSGAAVARWVGRNLRPPIRDVEAWGRLLRALCDGPGARLAIELTAGDFRRQGARGWMLANLAGAHHEREEWDQVQAVAEYALAETPHDHSFWWHRRYLAEVAYRRGDHARCRELCVMATEEFPTVKVKVQQFAALAEMAGAPSWSARRRMLGAALPEILRQAAAADADERGGREPTRLEWRLFWRAVPSLRALLMGLGRPGRRLLALLAG